MSRFRQIDSLREAAPAILPSLLLCDFGNLEREIAALEAAGVPGLHLDVMDGHFVPNLTYGMPIVAAIRRLSDLPLDVHLMIQHPDRYVRQFVEAGADLVTIHVEAADDLPGVIDLIRTAGAGAGIALNPETPLSSIEPCLDLVDLVLVMSVEAGFGGQEFNPIALEKLRTLKRKCDSNVLLEVDGGINTTTIADCAQAGAQLFVIGSAIFRADDYGQAVGRLTKAARITGE